MEFQLDVKVLEVRHGYLASTLSPKLAGFGATPEVAKAALIGSVNAWCSGLRRDGSLEKALARRGILSNDATPEVKITERSI